MKHRVVSYQDISVQLLKETYLNNVIKLFSYLREYIYITYLKVISFLRERTYITYRQWQEQRISSVFSYIRERTYYVTRWGVLLPNNLSQGGEGGNQFK